MTYPDSHLSMAENDRPYGTLSGADERRRYWLILHAARGCLIWWESDDPEAVQRAFEWAVRHDCGPAEFFTIRDAVDNVEIDRRGNPACEGIWKPVYGNPGVVMQADLGKKLMGETR